MGNTTAGLTSSLRSLVSALQTNQSTLSYISDNIANVNTTGYARRVVSQETQVSAGSGVGVNVTQIRRSIDEFLLKSVRGQLSKVGQSDVTNTYLDRLQNFSFGNPNSKFTINNSMSELYSRLENFSNNPSSAVNRNLVINSAKDFTNGLNQLAKSVQNERLNADTELSQTIDSLNTVLANLTDINKALRTSAAVGGDKQSLEDARDIQLNKVKSYIDAEFAFDEFGAVSVNLANAELLGFSQQYRIDYSSSASIDSFINNAATGAIKVIGLDSSGNDTNNVQTLLTASNAAVKIDNIPDGKLRGLIDLRDTKLPQILKQLDTFAYTFADAFNEVHSGGTGFPPPESLTGTESYSLSDTRNFTGTTRLSLVDASGQPVLGRYGEKVSPLNIDFSRLNGAQGFGTASTRDLINEINSYYGAQPANIASIGSANDIRIGAVSSAIASTKATGTITLSGQPTNNDTLVINGTTVTFKTTATAANEIQIGANLAATMDNIAEALNASTDTNIGEATYSVSGAVLNIEVDKSGTSGNAFTLDDSGTSVATASGATLAGGVNANGNFTFDFDFANKSADGSDITFDVTQFKINAGAFGAVTFDPYTQKAGERFRTDKNGVSNDSITASLTGLGLEEGDTFTVTATITVTDSNNVTKTEDVTFTVTVPDPDTNIKNTRYAATAIDTGDGELTAATGTTGFITASLVDANGNTITDDTTPGFLKLESTNSAFRIVLDQQNSKDGGDSTSATPSTSATNRGLTHFFGLNNFFDFSKQLGNAATNIKVRDDIIANPGLLSSGKVKQSVSLDGGAVYSYELGSGSNEGILDLIQLQDTNLTFAGTGGLPELTTTANFYATELYNYSATEANDAASEAEKNNLLKDSLEKKVDDISGVNLDEEIAKTIEIQNAYSAAAKILSIVRELFTKIEAVLS